LSNLDLKAELYDHKHYVLRFCLPPSILFVSARALTWLLKLKALQEE